MREQDLNALYKGSSMVADLNVEPDIEYSIDETNGADDCLMLMSMALDGLLDSAERARMEAMIAADAELADTWRQWSKVDSVFAAMPREMPVPGFTNRFEARLERKLAQQ